jgi:hypothetical protein
MNSTRLTEEMLDEAKKCPGFSLLVFGGFVYLDTEANVVAVNAFAAGKPASDTIELEFAKAEIKPDDVAALELESGVEFVPITIAEFVAAGAESFCWVPPKTKIGDHVVKHGGFA